MSSQFFAPAFPLILSLTTSRLAVQCWCSLRFREGWKERGCPSRICPGVVNAVHAAAHTKKWRWIAPEVLCDPDK